GPDRRERARLAPAVQRARADALPGRIVYDLQVDTTHTEASTAPRRSRPTRNDRVAAMSPAIPYRPPAMEAINLADLYQLPLLDWASIENKLRAGVDQAPGSGGPNRHTCWLSTI